MPEKELPLGKGRRPELAGDSESNGHEWEGNGEGPAGWLCWEVATNGREGDERGFPRRSSQILADL